MKSNTISIFLTAILMLSATQVSAKEKEGPKRTPVSYASTLPMPDTLASKSYVQMATEPLIEAKIGRMHYRRSGNSRYSNVRTGIDVSRYQGDINWDEVANDDQVGFAYVKATEGSSWVDRTYQNNLYGTKRAGIKVGCYHYFSPTADPREQFYNFSANYDPHQQELIPFVDVEAVGKKSSYELRERLNVFLQLFEDRYGFKPLIYTFMNFYNKHMSGYYNDYKFIIARYKDETPILDDGKQYVLWQYTTKSNIRGIAMHVDKNRFHEEADLSDIMMR